MRVFQISIVLTFIIVFCSNCSKDTMSKHTMWNMALKEDPNAELIIPEHIDKGIKCSDYGPGCLSGRMAKVMMVTLVALEFETMAFARQEAYRIDQFYSKNWVFDDVTDEPILEDFVRKVYNAKRPAVEEKELFNNN